MLPEMTPAVARALRAAAFHAHAAAAEDVLPLHVLHGLLAEEEGRAAILAIAAGLDWPAYRRDMPDEIHSGDSPVEMPLNALTLAVLRLARSLAVELTGDRTVAGEVLLCALLRCDEAVRQHLEPFGLQHSRLEAHLQANKPPPVALEESLDLNAVPEQVDLARVIDACANRAREGLRVVEDYCRFVLDDAFLCGELKRLRHDLTAALAGFSTTELLAARETQRDVGTTLSTEAEQRRFTLLEVAHVNMKRLQEALRSLEEFAKIHAAETGVALEGLRYRTYTLERAIALGTTARQRLENARLYVLLSAAQCVGPLERTIKEAAAGGAGIIQLREKDLDDRALLERAKDVRRWTREAGVLFIVNDRPDIARLVEADGVHLGQDDLPVKEARRIVGADALIGVSTHNLDQVRQAILDGASYLGVGPTFPSDTKEFAELAGLDFVRAALAETTLPAFVLGGVNLKTIGAAVAAGARRVAVSQAIAGAEDPRSTAAQLLFALLH